MAEAIFSGIKKYLAKNPPLAKSTWPDWTTGGVEDAVEQHRTQVAFSGVGQHDDDRLAGIFRFPGMAHRRRHGRTAGDPRQDSFLPGEAAGVLDSLFVRHLFDDINQREVEHLRYEAGADALDLVGTRLERFAGERLREYRAGGRLDRYREMGLPRVFLM
jgi:hypothetical protein